MRQLLSPCPNVHTNSLGKHSSKWLCFDFGKNHWLDTSRIWLNIFKILLQKFHSLHNTSYYSLKKLPLCSLMEKNRKNIPVMTFAVIRKSPSFSPPSSQNIKKVFCFCAKIYPSKKNYQTKNTWFLEQTLQKTDWFHVLNAKLENWWSFAQEQQESDSWVVQTFMVVARHHHLYYKRQNSEQQRVLVRYANGQW